MKIHRELGISSNLHGWRKVFTSKLINSGMGLLTVQTFTRHKSIDQLQIYYDRLDKESSLPTYYESF